MAKAQSKLAKSSGEKSLTLTTAADSIGSSAATLLGSSFAWATSTVAEEPSPSSSNLVSYLVGLAVSVAIAQALSAMSPEVNS